MIGFVIQARMQSTRLPGKVLMPIPLNSDKSMLKRIIEALKKSKFEHQIIVASSINEANDAIEDFCKNETIFCYRGDENNVLGRFIAIAKQHNFDAIVRLTADNPIVDIVSLDKVIDFHISENNDYTKSSGLPLGMNCEVIRTEIFRNLLETSLLSDYEREHVTPPIKNNENFKKAEFVFGKNLNLDKLRLTIDYHSDFLVLSTVLELLDTTNVLDSILAIKEKYPWIFMVNQENTQLS